MKAIVITAPGGPDVLQWQDVDDLTPGSGEVLIDVVASAVNRADVMQRQGHYPPPPGASPYPGLECSGRIAALGPDVGAGFSVGDVLPRQYVGPAGFGDHDCLHAYHPNFPLPALSR